MDFGLKDRVAVVTGGSSGIGLATAEMLLAEGARVAVCGRDETRLQSAANDLRSRHGGDRVLPVVCDVLVPQQVEALRERVEAAFNATDVLINNAGQARQSNFANTSDQDWRDELELKFFSLIHPTRAFLPLLEKSDIASVVCVNALLAKQPETYLVATSAARAGALNLAKGMSQEFASKGIRVNAILLGLIDSGQWRRRYEASTKDKSYEDWQAEVAAERDILLGRLGRPEEPAAAILFLASPLSSYITGTTIDVSGGHAKYV
jgi:NAD(P)-dependent dehydrogenase (short-subunit alcohol dehydrogenase family)